MKKKLTALLLAGVLCLGLVACGSKAEDTKEPEDTAEPDTVQTYDEQACREGLCGWLKEDEFIRLFLLS